MSASNIARRRAEQLRRTRNRRGGEDPVPLRLVICGVIFVLLVAVKLLFPGAVAHASDDLRRLIGRDADFKEAFAAVGRAVSGQESMGDSLQEAYAAVFGPSPLPEEEPAAEEEPEETPALRSEEASPAPVETDTAPADVGAVFLRQSGTLTLPEADREALRELVISGEAPVSPPAGEGDAPSELEADGEAVAAMSQVYTMAALPANASLEQRNLGFEHCTPVPGSLSSAFGWREHPIEGCERFHYGVDLAAAAGTDVLAFADGEVYASGESSSLGNYIMLRHNSGYITLYAHCSRITATGGRVSMGEKIAEVGSTGLATGPHLHFELHDGDLYLNPIYYVAVE